MTVLRQDALLLYNPCKDQVYSHNLHFRITELARRFNPETVLRQDTLLLYNPCKDQIYSHNLHFKIPELARRFNPDTVLRQDILLLYNPKECRGKKRFVLSSSLGTPRLLINLPMRPHGL